MDSLGETGQGMVVGRPVRVVSISFPADRSVEEIAALVDREGARGADLIALPETWSGNSGAPNRSPETLDGPAISAMAALARKHRTYIVSPIDRREGAHRLNSAVLLDRAGEIACIYDKVYPFWSEFDAQPAVEVGRSIPVYEADFGRVGMAICFDVNFPEVWQRLADQGAELVVWSSAYSAGTSLQAHALNHHFTIVSATQTPDCLVYDITGREILYERAEDIVVSRITLDLDRGIYHEDFNVAKRDRLLGDHGDEIAMEQWLELEKWFVLKARTAGVSGRALAMAYGLEELRDYIARSRREIDAMRGGGLSAA